MSEYTPSWKKQLEIQSNIRKSILIDGNINDLYYSTKQYRFIPVVSEIYQTLEDIGFDDVLYWDRESKIVQSFKSDDNIVNSITDELMDNNSSETDISYDIGNDSQTNSNRKTESIFENITDYFSFILKRLEQEDCSNKIAFVIDWSDSIFGSVNGLSEDDRYNLMLLEKAIRNSPVSIDNKGNNDVVILLTSSASSIPPKYYQDNKSITLINISKPNRKDREFILNVIYNKFNLETPLFPNTNEMNILNDMLDDMTVRDIIQLVKLSNLNKRYTIKKLISLYRYGDEKSPWEDLNKDRIEDLKLEIKQSVMGQDHVIDKIYTMVVKAYIGLSGLQHSSKQQTPKGTMFFVGPTGVGKTELAKSLARYLFGDEESYLRFDMSEYNHENSDQRLVGAPPGYVGYEEGGQLTNAVRNKPFSVLLFDEIEKAHPRILDKFLQILEDGRLTDGQGKTTYFTETVIIFTSNIGSKDIASSLSNEEAHDGFKNKVIEHFNLELGRPELLNRININNIIPFNFIKDSSVLNQILISKLKNLKERLKEKYNINDITFENEDTIQLLLNNHDPSSGGRGLLNLLSTKIIEPLSEFIFNNNHRESYSDKSITVKRFGTTQDFKFEFK